jgi:hypothetical protein
MCLQGIPRVDDMARAGLLGLSRVLYARTSVEPATPIGVDLERDELTFFPFLYWPITENTPIPSDAAYAKLNRYLRGGGHDRVRHTRRGTCGPDTHHARGAPLASDCAPAGHSPLGTRAEDHVLTRTFYLLQEFPGRYTGRDVWVEAAPADAERPRACRFAT